jgi:hypothetical protein
MASDLVPGTCKTGTIDPAGSITISTGQTLKPGYVASVTQNPPTNVEAGRTQAKSAYTTVSNSCAPIPDLAPIGAVATITTTGTVSTKADATYTAQATVVTPTGGTGCTLTYTVATWHLLSPWLELVQVMRFLTPLRLLMTWVSRSLLLLLRNNYGNYYSFLCG